MRNLAIYPLIVCGLSASALAAPSAKPAPSAAPSSAPASPAPPAAKAKPKAAPVHVAPPVVRAPASPAPSKDEVNALRSEVKALREDLNRAVGAPPATAPNPEREKLEGDLAEEQKKLAAIQGAVAGGLDPAAVADSIASVEARIAELQARLDKQSRTPEPAPTRSLYEVSADVQRLDAAASGQPSATPAATVVAASTPPKPLVDAQPPPGGGEMMEKMGLLPLEFTAFGDFFYRFEHPGKDDFHVGAVELDASLKLTPYVNVSTAIAFTGEEDAFGLGAFVIDCGLAGQGDGYPLKSKLVSKSGVSFGRFDVPFGIAYLQYPATENRLVTLPQAVQLTHAGWNDIGAQGYAVGEHWTAVGYVVNGPEHPISADATAPSRTAAGGRLSAKIDELIEVGSSAALDFDHEGPVMLFAGGDLQTTLGPFDVRGEYLLKHVKATGVTEFTHGVYGQALLKVDPAFFMARYDTVLEGSNVADRRLAGGAGVEIFPQGEVRAVMEQSLDSKERLVTLQLVGGSSFQPTGLRR